MRVIHETLLQSSPPQNYTHVLFSILLRTQPGFNARCFTAKFQESQETPTTTNRIKWTKHKPQIVFLPFHDDILVFFHRIPHDNS